MKNKFFVVILLLTFLSGCFPKNHSIVFKENKLLINYKDPIDSCSLVEKVDTIEITRDMIEDGVLKVKDIEISCPSLDTDTLGEKELIYVIEEKEFKVNVQIKDLISPTLKFEDRNLTVEQNDVSFNILSLVKAEDNYDSEIFVALASEFDVTLPGLYRVRIKASDSSNNVSYDELKITVVESDREVDKDALIPEKEIIYVPNNTFNEGKKEQENEIVNLPKQEVSSPPEESLPAISMPESRVFMFKDYVETSDPYLAAANACAVYGEQKFNEGYTGKYNCAYLNDPKSGASIGYSIDFK